MLPGPLRVGCPDVREATADDMVSGVQPSWVARPTSTAEAGALLASTRDLHLTVVPRGAGTKLRWGLPPSTVDVVVDMTAMSTVVDHTAGDLVVVVQAGCRLASLQEALGSAAQRLAIDETVPGATVGGTVAANASGPRRMLNGTSRDLLIGLTMVRADGVVAHAGGRVVKNVAGYDLGKLLTGSLGTLGVITEMVFRLHPVAHGVRVLSIPAPDPDTAARLVAAIVHSTVVPTAVELDWPSVGAGRVVVLLEGIAAGVAGRADTTCALLRAAGATDIDVAEQTPAWWGRYPWDDGGVGMKLTCVLSGTARLLAAGADLAARLGVPLHLRGSAGTGVFYGGLPADLDAAVLSELLAGLRSVCAGLGGTVVVLDAPDAVKAAVDVWGPVPAVALMRAVKQQFDPERRLAPGRFAGGI